MSIFNNLADLDAPEAKPVAPPILPPAGFSFGRFRALRDLRRVLGAAVPDATYLVPWDLRETLTVGRNFEIVPYVGPASDVLPRIVVEHVFERSKGTAFEFTSGDAEVKDFLRTAFVAALASVPGAPGRLSRALDQSKVNVLARAELARRYGVPEATAATLVRVTGWSQDEIAGVVRDVYASGYSQPDIAVGHVACIKAERAEAARIRAERERAEREASTIVTRKTLCLVREGLARLPQEYHDDVYYTGVAAESEVLPLETFGLPLPSGRVPLGPKVFLEVRQVSLPRRTWAKIERHAVPAILRALDEEREKEVDRANIAEEHFDGADSATGLHALNVARAAIDRLGRVPRDIRWKYVFDLTRACGVRPDLLAELIVNTPGLVAGNRAQLDAEIDAALRGRSAWKRNELFSPATAEQTATYKRVMHPDGAVTSIVKSLLGIDRKELTLAEIVTALRESGEVRSATLSPKMHDEVREALEAANYESVQVRKDGQKVRLWRRKDAELPAQSSAGT